MERLRDPGLLTARILLAAIFIISGYGKIMGMDRTVATMAAAGLPVANFLIYPTIAVELGGGILLAIGWKTRCAALALFLFLIPATLVFHAFWAAPEGRAMMQAINFEKNLAIMGGMLYVMFSGAGRFSVDGA